MKTSSTTTLCSIGMPTMLWKVVSCVSCCLWLSVLLVPSPGSLVLWDCLEPNLQRNPHRRMPLYGHLHEKEEERYAY